MLSLYQRDEASDVIYPISERVFQRNTMLRCSTGNTEIIRYRGSERRTENTEEEQLNPGGTH